MANTSPQHPPLPPHHHHHAGISSTVKRLPVIQSNQLSWKCGHIPRPLVSVVCLKSLHVSLTQYSYIMHAVLITTVREAYVGLLESVHGRTKRTQRSFLLQLTWDEAKEAVLSLDKHVDVNTAQPSILSEAPRLSQPAPLIWLAKHQGYVLRGLRCTPSNIQDL